MDIQNICQAIVLPAQKTLSSWFWTAITMLWSWYGLIIIIGLCAWIYYEIITRNGTSHYNSENGFSPTFNRVIGSGVYLLLQTITYFFFKLIFGPGIYCMPVPYGIHAILFYYTGDILHYVGFWPRKEKLNNRKKRGKNKYNKKF
jgi:hypothetical protein